MNKHIINFSSLNLGSGGFPDYDLNNIGSIPQRLDAIVLAATGYGFPDNYRPDIILLQDTHCWTKDTMALFAEKAEMQFYKSTELNDRRLQLLGHENGLAIFSNIPFVFSESIRLETRNALLCGFNINGITWHIVNAYLDDLDAKLRQRQAQLIIDQTINDPFTPSKHLLIGGDFNSSAPVYEGERLLTKLLRYLPLNHPRIQQIKDMLDYNKSVHKIMKQNGLESTPLYSPTFPSKLHPLGFVKPFLALDNFYTYGLDISDPPYMAGPRGLGGPQWVSTMGWNHNETSRASDHLAILSTFCTKY
jgi:Endonuclease/Exonuclease/phosphatase family